MFLIGAGRSDSTGPDSAPTTVQATPAAATRTPQAADTTRVASKMGASPTAEEKATVREEPKAASPHESLRADQERSRVRSAADSLVTRLEVEVTLEPETRDALAQVLRDEREAALEIKSAEADADKRREAYAELRQDFDREVIGLLSDEQLEAYRKLRPSR